MSNYAQQIEFLISENEDAALGTATVYLAGTTILATIWTTRDKSVVAANPHDLNANGSALLYADGVVKVDVKDSAGVSVPGFPRDNLSFGLQNGPWVDVEEYASLTAAIAAIGSTPTRLLINSTTTLTANATIPSTLALEVTPLGRINQGTYTLAINGPFAAGLHQVFTSTGAVTGLKNRIPEWWGAKDDDSTDSTLAFRYAVDAYAGGVIKLNGGTYRIAGSNNYNSTASILVSGKTDFTIDGHGSLIRIMDGTKRLLQFDTCKRVSIRNISIYGQKETLSSILAQSTFYLGAAAGDNEDITFSNVKSYYNATNLFYVGSIPTGIQRNIKMDRITMWNGHSMMLSYGVAGLKIDNVSIQHTGISVDSGGEADIDIDIQADAAHGNVTDVAVSNVSIKGTGDSTTASLTGPKRIQIGCASGSTIDNVQFNNVSIIDTNPNVNVSLGSDATISITDNNATRDQITGLVFNNVTIKNSAGIWLQSKNAKFNNLSMGPFTKPASYGATAGRAIGSSQSVSMAGSQFNNVSIIGWDSDQLISVADQSGPGVTFNDLYTEDCTGPVIVSDNSLLNNYTSVNCGSSADGAIRFSGINDNSAISNAIFKNAPYTAIKNYAANPAKYVRLSNIIYDNNAVDSDLPSYFNGNGDFVATAAPTTGVWPRVGTRVINIAPAVGQPKAWNQTVAGGAVSTTRANSTAYSLGVWATWTTGTTVWEVTTAGTSAGSPPSIVGLVVGDTVVDGTATWTMRSLTTATFVSEGNL